MEVLTPIPLILSQLCTEIKTRYTAAEFKFDPNMGYVESVSGLRSLRHSLDETNFNLFPLFVFNRTNMVPVDNFNRRFSPIDKDTLAGTATIYSMKLLQCDIMFKVFSKDVIFADTFEIMYGVNESVNQIRKFTVTLPDIGDFDFYIDWKNLDETEYSKTDNFYISKSFSGTLKGSFFIVDESTIGTNLITTIRAKIMNFHHQVLADITVP